MAIKNLINYISFLLIHSFVFITPLLAHEGATGVIKEIMDKFKMSKKIINYFPKGSDVAPSEASEDICYDPEGFKKAVNNFELASLKLIDNSEKKTLTRQWLLSEALLEHLKDAIKSLEIKFYLEV